MEPQWWKCPRQPEFGQGGGEGRDLTQAACVLLALSDRDGSGGALDRYEPINLQIGLPDLVSVSDSLNGPSPRRQDSEMVGRGDANWTLSPWGPDLLETWERRLSRAVAGQRGLPRSRRCWAGDNL